MRAPSVGAVLAVSVASLACGKQPAPPQAPALAPAPGAIAGYFPLEEGTTFSYATLEGGVTGMLVSRAHRVDESHAELRLSNATRRFVYRADGVAYDGGAYILKAPLTPGASWPGEHGGTTRITSTSKTLTVPAGTFTACVETTEEGGRVAGATYVSAYCPGVGLVLLDVKSEGASARAELRSHGPAIVIE